MLPPNMFSMFQFILSPLGKIYGLIMSFRRQSMKMSSSRYSAPVPTVSVGNIAWGGTGKTPVVEFLTGLILKERKLPVILTRGYGARPPYTPLLVSPGHTAYDVGDEPLMLSKSQPYCAIIVDPNRSRGAEHAVENLKPNIFILDDGFQHIHMDRELDLVLITPSDLQDGWNKVMPSGKWREGESALTDADAFIIKTKREDWDAIKALYELKFPRNKKPLFAYAFEPLGLVTSLDDFSLYPASVLADSPYAFVTGIGHPIQAKNSVVQLMGREPTTAQYYPDHHAFTKEEAEALKNLNMPIICTHKDVVKLQEFDIPNLWYVKSQAFFGASYGTGKSFPGWFNLWWDKQKETNKTKEKLGLTYTENATYTGSESAWGENLVLSPSPELPTLPQGWGPVDPDGSINQDNIDYGVILDEFKNKEHDENTENSQAEGDEVENLEQENFQINNLPAEIQPELQQESEISTESENAAISDVEAQTQIEKIKQNNPPTYNAFVTKPKQGENEAPVIGQQGIQEVAQQATLSQNHEAPKKPPVKVKGTDEVISEPIKPLPNSPTSIVPKKSNAPVVHNTPTEAPQAPTTSKNTSKQEAEPVYEEGTSILQGPSKHE